jgi:hypothetical protein
MKLPGLTLFALTLLTIAAACPAAGADLPTLAGTPAVAAAAPAQPGCQPVMDFGKTLKAETCPVAAPQTKTPEPEFLVGTRTCRCSCGFPCKTDADCGGAVGSCRAGITCC